MPFTPRRLLLTYDDTGGRCGAVVARMERMLVDRAFAVTVTPLAQAPTQLDAFDGVILGTPVSLRRDGPTAAVLEWIDRAEGLDEKKVALFSAFWLRPGTALPVLRARLAELGVEVVVEFAYWLGKPEDGDHVLPAECMVRIR